MVGCEREGAATRANVGVKRLTHQWHNDWTRSWQEVPMLWTVFVILLVLWVLGLVSSNTMGGFIHILLVVAVVVVAIQIVQGRRAV